MPLQAAGFEALGTFAGFPVPWWAWAILAVVGLLCAFGIVLAVRRWFTDPLFLWKLGSWAAVALWNWLAPIALKRKIATREEARAQGLDPENTEEADHDLIRRGITPRPGGRKNEPRQGWGH